MRLEFSNIGKIAKADITIEGITVVCGENNVGKSTIGKVLYAMYDGFKDASSIINSDRKKYIKEEFEKIHDDLILICQNLIIEKGESFLKSHTDILETPISDIELDNKTQKSVQRFLSNFSGKKLKPSLQSKYIKRLLEYNDVSETLNAYCLAIFKEMSIPSESINNEEFVRWNERAKDALNKCIAISDAELLGGSIKNIFYGYFFDQFIKIQEPVREAEITLSNSKGKLKIKFDPNGFCNEIFRSFSVGSDDLPIYIDDPRILDSINDFCFSRELLRPNSSLKPKKSNKKSNDTTDNIRIAMVNQKIQDEIKQLEQLMNGKFVIQNGIVKFKDNNVSYALSVENLSLGMKSMGVLERCLSSGFIQEGSIIILDEPEIHLHPEWQMKYAEYIVLLQKALDLRVLVTTHSPQFLRAIECYTDKYDTMNKLNVYAFEGESIKNCSYSEYGVSEIYEKMTAPYDELQDMIDEKYGESDE